MKYIENFLAFLTGKLFMQHGIVVIKKEFRIRKRKVFCIQYTFNFNQNYEIYVNNRNDLIQKYIDKILYMYAC